MISNQEQRFRTGLYHARDQYAVDLELGSRWNKNKNEYDLREFSRRSSRHIFMTLERIVWTACPGQLIEPGVIQHSRPAEGRSIAPRPNCTGANRRSSQHPSELNSNSVKSRRGTIGIQLSTLEICSASFLFFPALYYGCFYSMLAVNSFNPELSSFNNSTLSWRIYP
uniref:Uncharacterized protein n=1 Tax=Daphnia galeata TaxID=27404 RepID=A0A8J2RGE9_9CRUS|nr:unnamed protein product [Daphnia galeata]